MTNKEGDLRVWWIPNPPRQGFKYPVKSIEEAKKVLDVLTKYDLYLGEGIIDSNVQGLEIFNNGEWDEWYDEEYRDILEVERDEEEARP